MLFVIGFVFLRHKQLCTYEQAVEKGLLATTKNEGLCPNLLDQSEWGTAISNAFNLALTNTFSVKAHGELGAINVGREPSETCDPNEDPICYIKQMGGELEQTDGYTTMLLAVSDNRWPDGPRGPLWGNTDSLMVLSLNNETGKMLLISFPRDIYVEFNPGGGSVASKINSIYAFYGREQLVKMLEEIIGRPIHYSAIISFSVFSDLIDQLGGIDIYLTEKFQDLYPCSEVPAGVYCPTDFGWFSFPQGENHFNSFQAEVYSRSRYASSDYSRAKRQQNIVKAIVSNALNKDISLSERFSLYSQMYNTFASKVETDIEVKDLAGALSLFDKLSDDAATIVLDPSLDDGKLIYEYGITEVGWVTKFYDYSYASTRQYIAKIWDNLTFNIERPRIRVVNATGDDLTEGSDLDELVKNSPYAEVKYEADPTLDVKGVRIYNLSDRKVNDSLDVITHKISNGLIYSPKIDEVNRSTFNEDILIIVGDSSE